MDSERTSTAPSAPPSRRGARTAVPFRPLKRFVVVDTTDDDGDVTLPNGGRGMLLATYHSGDLARALARGERARGRTVVVFDSMRSGPKKPT